MDLSTLFLIAVALLCAALVYVRLARRQRDSDYLADCMAAAIARELR